MYKPTKKWLTAAATGVASVVASWIVTGSFDDVERGMVGTLIVALAGSYFKSNDAPVAGPVVQELRGEEIER